MAKTSLLSIAPELENPYYSDLQTGDRFIHPRIRPKGTMLSRKRTAGLISRSYIPQCLALWEGFTSQQKQDWKNADPHPQQHGWRTFTADQCKRIALGLEGVATPNQYHQDMVGQILIEAPAEEIKIAQPHPSFYWLYQKVAGKKRMYEAVEINEDFALPLQLVISYKSDLTSTGEGSFAHFYASVRHLYQGQNLNTDLIIDIPLSSVWDSKNETLTTVAGSAISYNLYIHLYKVRGTLLVDNIKAIHSSANWVRDTYCKKIEQAFTRQWRQIPRHWAPITLPSGAQYQSVYPT